MIKDAGALYNLFKMNTLRKTLTSAIIGILVSNVSTTAIDLVQVSAFNMLGAPITDAITPEQQEELDAKRPLIEFPDSFMVGISTNDPGLNLTEVLYYVSIHLN